MQFRVVCKIKDSWWSHKLPKSYWSWWRRNSRILCHCLCPHCYHGIFHSWPRIYWINCEFIIWWIVLVEFTIGFSSEPVIHRHPKVQYRSASVTATSAHCTTAVSCFPFIIIFTTRLSWSTAISSRTRSRPSSSNSVSLAPTWWPRAKDSSQRYITGVVGTWAYNIRVHRQTFHSDGIRSNPPPTGGFTSVRWDHDEFSIFYLDLENFIIPQVQLKDFKFTPNAIRCFYFAITLEVLMCNEFDLSRWQIRNTSHKNFRLFPRWAALAQELKAVPTYIARSVRGKNTTAATRGNQSPPL